VEKSVAKIQQFVWIVEKMGGILYWTSLKVKHGNGLVM
jgi:hypothetical protein